MSKWKRNHPARVRTRARFIDGACRRLDRCNVENDTVAPLQHGRQDGGAKTDDSAQVHIEDAVDNLWRSFMQSGRLWATRRTSIVDEHIRRTKARCHNGQRFRELHIISYVGNGNLKVRTVKSASKPCKSVLVHVESDNSVSYRLMKRAAIPAPMPDAAPVTITTRLTGFGAPAGRRAAATAG
jgi:hypothetical protein